MWALVIGFFMILVDSTIVSVATPALMRAFDADVSAVLWVTSAYLLAYAVPLLITGRLGDRLGPKRVYQTGLLVFTLASLWCGLSPTIGVLITARVVQGLGAACMTPQTMALITRTFPAERRGPAMALWGATAGVATLVGPVLGGLLIGQFGWEWIFFVNVPVGVLGLVLAARLVPALPTHAHSFDWVGVALSALGLFCFVFGIQEGETFDWGVIWGPVSVPTLIGAGMLLLGIFLWWQSRVRVEPLVPLRLFRDRNFTLANIAITTVSFTITSMIFPFMIYAQLVRGLSPTSAALLLAPQALASIVLAQPVGKLVDRVHPRALAGPGLLLLSVSTFTLAALMTPTSAAWQILLAAVVLGVASSLVWGPLSTTANRNLPMRMAGAGAGVYNTTRQMGAVLGSAAIAALMQWRLSVHLGGSGTQVTEAAGAGAAGAALPPAVAESFAQALAESLILPAGLVLLGCIAAVCFERPRHLRASSTATTSTEAAGPGSPSPASPSATSAHPDTEASTATEAGRVADLGAG